MASLKKYQSTFLWLWCMLLFMKATAQDIFVGTWESASGRAAQSVRSVLQIGKPERGLIYPAKMTLRMADRTYQLQFLLVRREVRRLAIGSLKYWENGVERNALPFSAYWNGDLEYSKDVQNKAMLNIQRIPVVKKPKKEALLKKIPKALESDASWLFDFFLNQEFPFYQKNDSAWDAGAASKLLQPNQSPKYLGMMDTFYAPARFGRVVFEKNKDNDLITVMLNDRRVVDHIDSKKSRDPEDIILDTGLNLLVFMLDEFGKKERATAGVDVYFEDRKRHLSFKDTLQTGTTFIIQKVYVKYRAEEETGFEEIGEHDARFSTQTPPRFKQGIGIPSTMTRKEKIIGRMLSRSTQLTFAIWDDAVEDGDSISLRINDRWITQGFPVRKKPQFITVNLDPGPNYISFIADNLGSIVPNTSVLEIIDGKRRKSFHIETDLDQNNQVRIYYELR
jgi:hypothetical protein